MTYYRALKDLWHTAREERGENPIVPAGACCDLNHRTEDEQNMLVAMEAVTPIGDEEYAEWLAAKPQPDKMLDSVTPTYIVDVFNEKPAGITLPAPIPEPENPAPPEPQKRRKTRQS